VEVRAGEAEKTDTDVTRQPDATRESSQIRVGPRRAYAVADESTLRSVAYGGQLTDRSGIGADLRVFPEGDVQQPLCADRWRQRSRSCQRRSARGGER
jgi:hypothetical protein